MSTILFWLIAAAIGVFYSVTTRQQRKGAQAWFWIVVAVVLVLSEVASLIQYGHLTVL